MIIRPNPNNGKFTVELIYVTNKTKMEIYDHTGKVVFETPISSLETRQMPRAGGLISRCSSRERAEAACSSARESGCCDALVLRRAAEAESAILSTSATEAVVHSRQRACSHDQHISRCSTLVCIVASLGWTHGMCGRGRRSDKALAEISQPPTKG